MLIINSISKYFNQSANRITALENISITCIAGNKILLYGNNASGKTTLLKCIQGLLIPDTGSIEKRISHPSKLHFVTSITESFYPRLTIIQNLIFFCSPYISDQQLLKNELKELINYFSIKEFESAPFQNCSHGIQKRVGLICGLIGNPEILLIDEWDDTIDAATNEKLTVYFNNIHCPGILICSSLRANGHAHFFNRAIMLTGGSISFDGNPAAVP